LARERRMLVQHRGGVRPLRRPGRLLTRCELLIPLAADRFVNIAWSQILVLRDAPLQRRSLRHEDFYGNRVYLTSSWGAMRSIASRRTRPRDATRRRILQ